jgi:Na+-translocating ferredoxin:NAD+ oxidoreductase RnfG subunit
MKKTAIILALTAMACAGLTACGSSEKDISEKDNEAKSDLQAAPSTKFGQYPFIDKAR